MTSLHGNRCVRRVVTAYGRAIEKFRIFLDVVVTLELMQQPIELPLAARQRHGLDGEPDTRALLASSRPAGAAKLRICPAQQAEEGT